MVHVTSICFHNPSYKKALKQGPMKTPSPESVVQGGEGSVVLDGLKSRFVDQGRLLETLSPVDHAMSDSGNFLGILDRTTVGVAQGLGGVIGPRQRSLAGKAPSRMRNNSPNGVQDVRQRADQGPLPDRPRRPAGDAARVELESVPVEFLPPGACASLLRPARQLCESGCRKSCDPVRSQRPSPSPPNRRLAPESFPISTPN